MTAPGTPQVRAGTPAPQVRAGRAGPGDFRAALRSEWTKFRSVRAWLVGLLLAAVFCVTFTFLVANGQHSGSCTGPPPSPGSTEGCVTGHPFVATGPSGEAVADSYELVGRPLTGDGTVTARLTSLSGRISAGPSNVAPTLADTSPGLSGWAKAGILLTPVGHEGSSYAAVMATGGHGVRFQYDYTHDRAGLPGSVKASSPRWLRLTRTGDTVTGYDSADGRSWSQVGTAYLGGLPSTVQVGLFVTSPLTFRGSAAYPSLATGTFDRVAVDGRGIQDGWHGHSIGTSSKDFYPTLGNAGYHRAAGAFVVTGTGDIGPAVVEGLLGSGTASGTLYFGLLVGLVVLIVVAASSITGEYRRGLIRTTFTATPARGRVLAAKAAVMGTVAFVVGAVAASVAMPLGSHLLAVNGNYVFPAGALTDLRVVAGAGLLLAMAAVAALGAGAMLRRGAGAVAAGVVVFVLPYIVGTIASGGVEEWVFRITPAAGFAVLEALPRSAEVSYPYTFANGYYPLSWWAGLLVVCGWAAAALAAATALVRRRDA